VGPRIGHKVDLKLIKIAIQSAVKSDGCRQRRYGLSDYPINIGISELFNLQVVMEDVVNCLTV
jgi:hypothetical protein